MNLGVRSLKSAITLINSDFNAYFAFINSNNQVNAIKQIGL